MRDRVTAASQGQRRGPPAALGWILITFGLFFLGAAIWNDARRVALGRYAGGELVRITERTSIGGGSDGSGKRRRGGGVSHVLTVRYTPENGTPIEVDTLATWGFSEKVGDRVRLIYLPGAPERAEIYSVKQVWLPLATGFTVSTLCLVGGAWILRWRRRLAAGS